MNHIRHGYFFNHIVFLFIVSFIVIDNHVVKYDSQKCSKDESITHEY